MLFSYFVVFLLQNFSDIAQKHNNNSYDARHFAVQTHLTSHSSIIQNVRGFSFYVLCFFFVCLFVCCCCCFARSRNMCRAKWTKTKKWTKKNLQSNKKKTSQKCVKLKQVLCYCKDEANNIHIVLRICCCWLRSISNIMISKLILIWSVCLFHSI